MGMDMIAFIERCWPNNERFSGVPENPAWCLAKFWPSRDYYLFDALADARSSTMGPDDIPEYRALYPPRGIPPDLSLEAAWEYYDLIVESKYPDEDFWPPYCGLVTADQADTPRLGLCYEASRRGGQGKVHYGVVAQITGYTKGTGLNVILWRAVSKVDWVNPSWLYLREIRETLAANRLSEDRLEWDFRVILRTLAEAEKEIGQDRVRLTFRFVD